jgi:hypothetical protein
LLKPPFLVVDPERFYRYSESRINLFIFFACPKKKNQKKGHQSFAPLTAGYPVLLDPAGSFCGARLHDNGKSCKAYALLFALFDGATGGYPLCGWSLTISNLDFRYSFCI